MFTHRAFLGFSFIVLINLQLQSQNIGLYQATLEPYQSSCKYSKSLSGAGDVNQDGYEDIAVGAYIYDNGQSNEGRLYLYYGSSTGVIKTAAWTFECDQASAQLGFDLKAGKDINNDGYPDLIASANLFDNGQTDEGKVYMFLGSATGFSSTPTWTYESNNATATLGNSIDFAGDVNNDGYEDVIVGAMNYDMAVNEGKVFVFYGNASGLPATPNWEKFGFASSRFMGTLVSAAGDVNNDGFDDVAIVEKISTATHRIYLFNGSAAGLSATYTWNKDVPQKPFDIESGDLNNDGYTDLLIGCPDDLKGSVFCYNGTATGISTVLSWKKTGSLTSSKFGYSIEITDLTNDGYNDLAVNDVILKHEDVFFPAIHDCVHVYSGNASGIDTVHYYTLEHTHYSYTFGYSISFADHNGDGYKDIVVGNPESITYPGWDGMVYVVNSSAMGLFGGEHNFFYGPAEKSYLGELIDHGDINNDGFSDMVSTARGYSGDDPPGYAFIFYGSENYLNGTPQTLSSDSTWETVPGESRVLAVGDLNGDGFDDVVTTDDYYDGPEDDEGIARAYAGSASGINTIPFWQYEPNLIDANFGQKVQCGDFNNDNYDDLIVQFGGFDDQLVMFLGSAAGPGLIPAWELDYDNVSWMTALDFNGDGYEDLVLGDGAGEPSIGKVSVFNGGPGGLPLTASHIFNHPEDLNNYSGIMVSSAGDLNGDGFADFIASSEYYENGENDEGGMMLFYGSPSGTLDPVIYESNEYSARFGEVVSGIGDFNNDGFSDLVATVYDPDESRLFYGSSLGVDTSYYVVLNQHSITNSGIGDVNGDGFDDFATGDELYDPHGFLTDAGNIIVYYGGLTFTDETYCNVPTGTVVAFVNPSGAGINWDNSPDVNEFIIRWKKTLDATWNYDTTLISSYFLTGIEPCATYQFQVRTNCEVNESGWTALGSFASYCTEICEQVTGLTVDSTHLANIYVSWEPAAIGEGYIVDYKRTDLAVWQNLFVTTPSATITPVTYCKDYEIRVRTVCSDDTSGYSSTVSTETYCTSCYSAPDDLFVTNITPSSAKIHWDADPDPDSYKVYYRQTGTVTWTKKNSTTNVKKITGLLPATTYEYRIKTFCAGGISTAFSVISTFTTLPLRENEIHPDLFSFSIFPNPALDEISLLLHTSSDNKVIIEISSMSGATVLRKDMNYQELISIQTELSSGTYILTISQDGMRSNQLLIIQ